MFDTFYVKFENGCSNLGLAEGGAREEIKNDTGNSAQFENFSQAGFSWFGGLQNTQENVTISII